MATQLEDDLNAIKKEAAKFAHLDQFLNWRSLEAQAQRKYPGGITPSLAATVGKPFDVLQALLAPAISFSGPLDFKSNLAAIDLCISVLSPQMNPANRQGLKSKLSNIGVASFWDTLGELWFAQQYLKAGQSVQMDFPLHPQIGNNKPADADIAIIDATGKPVWLIDAVCPQMPPHLDALPNGDYNTDPAGAKLWIESEVERKFQSKFSAHITGNAPAQAAVIITLIKADLVSAHFLPLAYMPPGLPVQLDKALKQRCPGLGYAVAVRFQRNAVTGGLEIAKLAELS